MRIKKLRVFSLSFFGIMVLLAGVCPNGAPPNQGSNGLVGVLAANTNVNVYIDSNSFPSVTDQGYIRSALSNWQMYIPAVTYNVTVTAQPPVAQDRSLVVHNGIPPDGKIGYNGWVQSGTAVLYAVITIDTSRVSGSLLLNLMVHELGHNYSLGDCTACSNTDMSYPITTSSPVFPTGCDDNNIYNDTGGALGANNSCTTTPPTCSGGAATCSSNGFWSCPSTGSCPSGYCGGYCLDNVCPGGGGVCKNGQPNCTHGGSPIIIDWDGSGVHLTGPQGAKLWTFFPGRSPVRINWIDPGSSNVFLVLDRNENGSIDNATEMFGNLTEQPPSTEPNGFAALAVFDLPENGGNGDGIIDKRDRIYSRLRLMRADMSLHSLPEYGIEFISLHYTPARRIDRYGNEGEFKSLVGASDDRRRDTVAYDWWLSYIPDLDGQLETACARINAWVAGNALAAKH